MSKKDKIRAAQKAKEDRNEEYVPRKGKYAEKKDIERPNAITGKTRSQLDAMREKANALISAKNEEFEVFEGNPYSKSDSDRIIGKALNNLDSKSVTEQDLINMGYVCEQLDYKFPPFEMRKALRFEFDGSIQHDASKCSDFFAEKKRHPGHSQANPFKYNMQDNKMLNALSQFESFASYKMDLCKVFSHYGIAPEEIKQLNTNDIFACITKVAENRGTTLRYPDGTERTGRNGEKIGLMFEGKRSKFLKDLHNNYSDAIAESLKNDGKSEAKITEFLDNLREGKTPTGYNVHHRIPIAGFMKQGELKNVNEFSNFVLIRVQPCHDMIHSYEENTFNLTEYHDKYAYDANAPTVPINAYRPKDGVVFFGGPNQNAQVNTTQKNKATKQLTVPNTEQSEIFMHAARTAKTRR